jgi:thiosulfate/3-mercaptopyruvate sulfurtransferase
MSLSVLRCCHAGTRSAFVLRGFFYRQAGTFITPSSLHSFLSAKNEDKVKILDIRSPAEYSTGHIPSAVNCHEIFTYLGNSDKSGVEKLVNTFTDLFQSAGINGGCGEQVVTYENSLQSLFGASCRGFYLLKLLGHQNVSILEGGLDKWISEGYPTSKDPPAVQKGSFKAQWSPTNLWTDKDEVIKALKEKNVVFLDVRDLDEWKGTSSSPYGVNFTPRKGRLPGSVHILWSDFMEKRDDGFHYFKSPEAIREVCARKGIRPEQNVIVYCFKGARASNTLVALKEAGFTNASNYFSSWNEWSRHPELEIDPRVIE